MKNSPIASILLGILTVSALATIVMLIGFYIPATREIRAMTAQVNMANQHQQFIQGLATDSIEYGKTHPAINTILESMGVIKPTQNQSVPGHTPNK